MSDSTWMSPEELAKCSRAYDVESEEFCSPIPTQNVSNGEYLPKPQTEKQQQVEARIKELADGAAKKLGVSRREFLASSGGMAASLIAMNDVYGKFFAVDKAELFEPAAAPKAARPRRGTSTPTLSGSRRTRSTRTTSATRRTRNRTIPGTRRWRPSTWRIRTST